jgi:60 kDa SS-A/Ro ribonucleoprotein
MGRTASAVRVDSAYPERSRLSPVKRTVAGSNSARSARGECRADRQAAAARARCVGFDELRSDRRDSGLTPHDASAALALLTAAIEARYEIVGFFAGPGGFKPGPSRFAGWTDGLTPLQISPRQRLDDAVQAVSDLPYGGTDCALPMRYAQALEREVDAFVIYTDSETWAGNIHPLQPLRDYRHASGIDARLEVVGMVSNGFSIADPADGGTLDVVGCDTATPQLIADFARGTL